MKLVEKIPIVPIDLHRQKILKVWEGKVVLYDNAMRYVIKFKAKEPENDDEALEWKPVVTHVDISIMRAAVTAVSITFNPDRRMVDDKIDYWSVHIYAEGLERDLPIYFNGRLEAERLHDRLLEYFFGVVETENT